MTVERPARSGGAARPPGVFGCTRRTAASPEDSQIFDALRSSLARLDPKTVAALKTLPGRGRTRAVRLPDSGFFAAGGDDGGVWVADLAAPHGRAAPRPCGRQRDPRPRVGRWRQAAGGRNPRRPGPRVLDPAATAAPAVLVGPGPGVTAFAANARGNLLAVAIANGDVTLRSARGRAAPRRARSRPSRGEADRVPGVPARRQARRVQPERRHLRLEPRASRRRAAQGSSATGRFARWRLAPDGRLAAGTEDGPILLAGQGTRWHARRVDRSRIGGHVAAIRESRSGGSPRPASTAPPPVGGRPPGTRTNRADRTYRMGLGGGLRRPRTAARVGRRRSDDAILADAESNRSPRRSASASSEP